MKIKNKISLLLKVIKINYRKFAIKLKCLVSRTFILVFIQKQFDISETQFLKKSFR